MAKSIWVKASFWKKLLISFNMLGLAVQGILVGINAEHVWNFVAIIGQAFGNIGALWTEDRNNDGTIDIVQEQEVNTTIKTVGGEVVSAKTEIKPKEE